MRMIEADKVIPLVRLLLMFHPNAERILEDMQAVVDSHTIEAEPVVRCEDCKHWRQTGNTRHGICHCGGEMLLRWKHQFCSNGKRRNEDA